MHDAVSTLAISLCPEEALSYLTRIFTTLVVFGAPEPVLHYQGRILIHSLGFPDDPREQCLCDQILQEFSFDPLTFPALAIQGSVAIADIFQYDSASFAADKQAHGYKDSLEKHRVKANRFNCEVWGIRLCRTYFLDEPVYDVIPPNEVSSGSFWLAESIVHLEAFRLALQRDVTFKS